MQKMIWALFDDLPLDAEFQTRDDDWRAEGWVIDFWRKISVTHAEMIRREQHRHFTLPLRESPYQFGGFEGEQRLVKVAVDIWQIPTSPGKTVSTQTFLESLPARQT